MKCKYTRYDSRNRQKMTSVTVEMADPVVMQDTKPKDFLFIDGSYFCFHRYYSILRWWKNAHPLEPEVLLNPFENDVFREKFIKTFMETVSDLPKKLGLSDPTIIVGRDCKRENIWRNEIHDKYKATRKNGPEDGFMGGPFFKMVHDDGLFVKSGAHNVLTHDKLEADDCIAISVKQLLKKYNDADTDKSIRIFVVTSDKDYLQLHQPNVKIFDLAYQDIALSKSSFGDAAANLFCKIVMGDPSDNISSIFAKCGPKTALKCWRDPAYFQKKMEKEKDALEKYDKNRMLIDFSCIPNMYVDEFLEKYSNIITSW